jgi:hypothetical protein
LNLLHRPETGSGFAAGVSAVRRRRSGSWRHSHSRHGLRFAGVRHRQGDGEDGAVSASPVAGFDRSAHGFDEATTDGKAKAGAGALAVGLAYTIELAENALQFRLWNA